MLNRLKSSHTHIILKISFDDAISVPDRISGRDKASEEGRTLAGVIKGFNVRLARGGHKVCVKSASGHSDVIQLTVPQGIVKEETSLCVGQLTSSFEAAYLLFKVAFTPQGPEAKKSEIPIQYIYLICTHKTEIHSHTHSVHCQNHKAAHTPDFVLEISLWTWPYVYSPTIPTGQASLFHKRHFDMSE